MSENEQLKSGIREVVIGTIAGVLISLFLVAVFSLFAYLFDFSSGVAKPVNQVIKVLSIFTACMFFIKGKLGYLKGGIVGILTTLIVMSVLTAFGANLKGILVETLFSMIIGVVSGIIAINVKK